MQLKTNVFDSDIKKSSAKPYKWEKKGADIFRPKAIERYISLKSLGFRLLNLVQKMDGKVFYFGIKKEIRKLDGNSLGLYKTVLSNAIRRLDRYCEAENSNFILVLDQHDAHHDLLECAAKTMFGKEPARRLLSPPYHVESYLNQNMQAADWVASITGRLWAHRLQSEQYEDHQKFSEYYWQRLHQLAVHSAVNRRGVQRRERRNENTALGIALTKVGFNPS